VVPPILAVRKKQRWWVSLLKLLAGTAGTAALVGAVAFAAGQVRVHLAVVAVFDDVAVQVETV
jgi:presenilin-like A22 family membrane protease